MAAQCPRCAGNPALGEFLDKSGVEYDACLECKGVWFDKGELARVLGAAPDTPLLDPKPSKAPCPRCKTPMQTGGCVSPMLRVDACPACGGTWLDPGELRLVRKLLGVTEAAAAPEAPAGSAAPVPQPPDPPPAAAITPPLIAASLIPEPTRSASPLIPPANEPMGGQPVYRLPPAAGSQMAEYMSWMVVGGGLLLWGLYIVGSPALERIRGADYSVDQAKGKFNEIWSGMMFMVAGAAILIKRPTLGELITILMTPSRNRRRTTRSLFDGPL